MPHRFPHGTAGVSGQPLVQFQLAQRDHRADGKALVRLFHGVQPQTRQVDGGADIELLHFEPDHAAEDPIVLFLVELPSFFQTFRALVFPDRHHTQYLSFSLITFILTYFLLKYH